MPLSWVEIDLSALRYNFMQVRQHLLRETQILGVVKSDAYGHGMVPVAKELAQSGCRFLGVSKYWEAEKLRNAGLKLPILVLLGIEPEEMHGAIAQNIRPVLFRLDHARSLSHAAMKLQKTAPFHVKVDTGMGRLGVPHETFSSFLGQLKELPGLHMEGILSHFSAADEADKTHSELQVARFREALQLAREYGFNFSYAHIANSAGLLDLPHAQFQLVRPGIMLYGSPPSDEILHPVPLRPVMALKTRVMQVKQVPAGQPIGYGKTFTTPRSMKIATLPVGYDDGYSRLLSNQGAVLIKGQRAPLVGRVSMNLITVDVTHIQNVCEEDESVLLGQQGTDRISAEEMACLCKTISYEIFCSLGRNRNRHFLNASFSE